MRVLLILCLFALPLTLCAESLAHHTHSYLFDGEEGVNIDNVFMQVSVQSTETFGIEEEAFYAIGGGIVINDWLHLGGEVRAFPERDIEGTVSDQLAHLGDVTLRFGMAFGGITFEPYIYKGSVFKLSFPLLVFGGLSRSELKGLPENAQFDNVNSDALNQQSSFMGIEFGVNYEFLIYKRFGPYLGISYREVLHVLEGSTMVDKDAFNSGNVYFGLRVYINER